MLLAHWGSRMQSEALLLERRRIFAPGASNRLPSSAIGSGFQDPSAGSLPVAMPRAAAALVAIVCWAGLAVQFSATYGAHHHVVSALWILARFFTILTNLMVATAMTWIAIGQRTSAFVLGGLTIAILLVGVVYALLLAGLHELRGPAFVADILLHKVSPVLMALWWLLF